MVPAGSWQQRKRVNRLNRMSIQESAAAYESATQYFLNLARGVMKDHLDTKNPEGWSARQIIHHLADSHMNAFIRFKLGLTEEHPTIKPYDQNKWAETVDVKNVPVNNSITLLHALHRRWHALLITLNESDFMRTVYHPEQQKDISLWQLLQIYAWHGKHHATQVIQFKERVSL